LHCIAVGETHRSLHVIENKTEKLCQSIKAPEPSAGDDSPKSSWYEAKRANEKKTVLKQNRADKKRFCLRGLKCKQPTSKVNLVSGRQARAKTKTVSEFARKERIKTGTNFPKQIRKNMSLLEKIVRCDAAPLIETSLVRSGLETQPGPSARYTAMTGSSIVPLDMPVIPFVVPPFFNGDSTFLFGPNNSQSVTSSLLYQDEEDEHSLCTLFIRTF